MGLAGQTNIVLTIFGSAEHETVVADMMLLTLLLCSEHDNMQSLLL